MGLFKRGQVWWMRFTYRGQQIRKSAETIDKKLAERIYRKILGEIAQRKWFERLPGDEKTVADLLEKYLAEYASTQKAPGTIKGSKVIVKELQAALGHLTLNELAPQHIVDYKVQCRERKLAPVTINHRLDLLAIPITWQLRNGGGSGKPP